MLFHAPPFSFPSLVLTCSLACACSHVLFSLLLVYVDFLVERTEGQPLLLPLLCTMCSVHAKLVAEHCLASGRCVILALLLLRARGYVFWSMCSSHIHALSHSFTHTHTHVHVPSFIHPPPIIHALTHARTYTHTHAHSYVHIHSTYVHKKPHSIHTQTFSISHYITLLVQGALCGCVLCLWTLLNILTSLGCISSPLRLSQVLHRTAL
jgi:hypothetical protein